MSTANDNWPPRSPHDVLLSTPRGRERLRRLAERASPSPTPTKGPASRSSPQKRTKALQAQMGLGDLEDDEDEDEDEDEETLQLKLQEIQARLKLKRKQNKAKQNSDGENIGTRAAPAPLARANSSAAERARSRISESRQGAAQSKSQPDIQVPASPTRRAPVTEPGFVRSPGRVLLGIDKGLKGSDISLKRAPSLRKPQDQDLAGASIRRHGSQATLRGSGHTTTSQAPDEGLPGKSFSERLAAMRGEDDERQARRLRIQKTRSQAFDIDHKKMQSYKEKAVELPQAPDVAPEFSRDQVLSALSKPVASIPRSKTASLLRPPYRVTSSDSRVTSGSNRPESQASDTMKTHSSSKTLEPDQMTETQASDFEPYSSLQLSKRIIPHKELTRNLSGKKTFCIPDLLRDVKAPDFSGPDVEEDVVVLGIIASKSEPRSHQTNDKNKNRDKFMIMTLTDLKWELELFLFDTAFDQFWKMTPGTIIAILNPTFMGPPRGKEATNRFSIVLNSNADTVLEIGSARDLGFCKSIKKDGKTCDSWIDKRRTEFCNFHVNLTLEKALTKRMEINTMTFGKGRGAHKCASKDGTSYYGRGNGDKKEGPVRYDRDSHSQIYIGNRSTVNRLDDVDFDADHFHRGSKEERLTKRLLEQERERALGDKLKDLGSGLGAEYMKKKHSWRPNRANHENSKHDESAPAEQLDPVALGLLGGKAKDVQLSPVNKRKRSDNLSNTAAVGWGGNLTKELGRMRDGERLQPVKKKTRFITEKGIREAGRESFGGEAVKTATFVDDNDDDDLDIVRE